MSEPDRYNMMLMVKFDNGVIGVGRACVKDWVSIEESSPLPESFPIKLEEVVFEYGDKIGVFY